MLRELEDSFPDEIPLHKSLSPPIKVLWLIKGLGPGGAEHLLTHAARVRDRRAFQHEVAYLLPWKQAMVGSLEDAGLPVHCLDGGREWDFRWMVKLRSLLMRRPFDVVHVHSPYVAAFARLVVRTLPRRTRPKLLSTEHVPWSGYVAMTRFLNALTFRLDSAHLAVSHAVHDSIPRLFRQDVEVVVHGIELNRVRNEAKNRNRSRTKLDIRPEEVLVGTVANFRAQKGYHDLLVAADRVIGSGLPVRFLAVGQGPLETEIRALHHSLGLSDRFLLLGYHENPARILAACDLFVLASLYEGLPLAMMEALALGLPVVGTRVPGIKEGITDGVEGVLVPASRPDLLAAEIERLVRDPRKRARMADAARARATEFDISRAVRRTEAIYQELIQR